MPEVSVCLCTLRSHCGSCHPSDVGDDVLCLLLAASIVERMRECLVKHSVRQDLKVLCVHVCVCGVCVNACMGVCEDDVLWCDVCMCVCMCDLCELVDMCMYVSAVCCK